MFGALAQFERTLIPERTQAGLQAAQLFGVGPATVYRTLKALHRPKDLRRADRKQPRAVAAEKMARYYEIVTTLKIRTSNGQGRKFSTDRAIEILKQPVAGRSRRGRPRNG